MRLVVDGVAFQAGDTGRARAWRSLLPALVADGRFELHVLDRGDLPPVEGAQVIPFPSHHGAFPAADSFRIERLCRHLAADAFVSTGWTTPVGTPSLLLVDPSLTARAHDGAAGAPEREVAVSHARRYACSSEVARGQLLRLYPEIPEDHASLAPHGVDPDRFHPGRDAGPAAVPAHLGLRARCLVVAPPAGDADRDPAAQALLDALGGLADASVDVLCVGNDAAWADRIRARLRGGASCAWVSADDDGRAAALAGALALVQLDAGAGSGQATAEALAAGCPVVALAGTEPAEYAGPAGIAMTEASARAVRAALDTAMAETGHDALRRAAIARAGTFRWDATLATIAGQLEALHDEARSGLYDDFAREWTRLRQMQVDLDFGPGAAPPPHPGTPA